MYNGVKAMIKAERELELVALKCKDTKHDHSKECKAGAHLKTPADITNRPVFPAGTTGLLCKYLSERLYLKYHG